MAQSTNKKSSTEAEPHVAVLVFPFASHPIAMLGLVKKLALRAPQVHFSFFSGTKSNHSLFQPSSNSPLPTNIKPYAVDHGVPVGHVLSSQNPLEEIDLFLNSCLLSFTSSIEMAVAETGHNITSLICDSFVSTSSAEIAEALRVPWLAAWISCPSALCAHINTHLIRQRCLNTDGALKDDAHGGTLDFIPGMSDVRISDVPHELFAPNLQSSLFFKMLSELGVVLPRAASIIICTYEELNPPPLNHVLKSKFRNVLSVGFFSLNLPLPPLPPSDSDPTGCLSWLDGQKARSVAYVSLGTTSVLPHDELVALAEALEETKVPFLWSLKDHSKKALPSEFLEKTKRQGKIVGWAPQIQVLAHESVEVFVTHCGANSVYESVAMGVPLIGRPFFGDHGMFGRLVESIWKDGLQVEGGKFTKNGLVKSLNLILDQENEHGKNIRQEAKALKELVLKADHGPNSIAARDFKTLVALISTTTS